MDNLVSLILMIVCGATVAYTVLRPVSKASQFATPLERFFIVDVIALIVLLQIPLTFLSVVSQMRTVGEVAVTGGFLVLMVIAIWWRGVSILSSLSIFGNTRRFLFIVVVLPFSLLGSMATYPMFLVVVEAMRKDFEVDTPPLLVTGSFVGILCLPFAVYGLRKLTNWVIHPPVKEVESNLVEATTDPF